MNRKTVYEISKTTPREVEILHMRPERSQAPKTLAWVQCLPGKGMDVTMRCYERKPRAIWHNPNNDIYTDSCMEFYVNCFPEHPQKGYLNLEMNSNGAAFCSFGTSRHARSLVLEMGLPHPEVDVEKGDGWWQVHCLISAKLFEALYGLPFDFPVGHRMEGNFYKCGDHTADPHWGSWVPMPRLDFHDPDSFGTFVITE